MRDYEHREIWGPVAALFNVRAIEEGDGKHASSAYKRVHLLEAF